MKTFSIFWRQNLAFWRNFLAGIALLALITEQIMFVSASSAYAADLPIATTMANNSAIATTAAAATRAVELPITTTLPIATTMANNPTIATTAAAATRAVELPITTTLPIATTMANNSAIATTAAAATRAADLPITPDGTTNTQIDRAANNVPIVNIATPNAGGLSHNKFENFNVNPSGLILNNAIGNQNGVVQTQIGGLINDNANLKNSGAASIILNEVTSNNISYIRGYIEIADKKADLVLANPAGFVFNGGGFINVDRFSAVVGSSNQFNPNPNDLTFRLSDNAYAVTQGFLPKLTIMGAGIDLENITSTDLVANVMNIVAPVYGLKREKNAQAFLAQAGMSDSESQEATNDVNLRTGDASFNYLTKTVTSDNTTPGSNLPDQVAIDASALGKIQAGRIFIVATKEGFGIKYSGDLLASRAGITIDNQGNIDYNNIASGSPCLGGASACASSAMEVDEIGNISVTSQKGSITQRGISQTKNASSDIVLNAAFGDITNYGQFVSARNINIDSGATFRNESAALNLSDNDFIIDAVDFTNLGQIAANHDLRITATTSLNNSSKLVAGRELTLTAPQITNDDSIYAENKITINASNYLTNNKDIISLGLGLVENEDGSFSGNEDDGILINAKTLNNNRDIKAKNNITINSNALNNNTSNSLILAFKDVNLNAINVDNSNANIEGGRNLALRNLTLNAPTVAANFGVTSQATSITNTGGTFYAGSLLDFDLGRSSPCLGGASACGTQSDEGSYLADYTIIGNLQSSGNLKIKANNITNQANLQADGDIEIIATDKFINGLVNASNQDVKIVSGTYLNITSENSLTNYGILSAKTNLTLKSINGDVNNSSFAREVANFLTSLFDESASTNKLDNYFSGKQSNLLSRLKSDSTTDLSNADSSSLLSILTDFLNSKQKADNKILPDNFASKTGWDLYDSLKSHINSNKSYYQLQVTPDSSRIAADVIGGTGKLSLIAKNGTVNQNSLNSIVANGDYSLDVTDFVNTGRVDVAGNLTLNVSNNLVNEDTAMIFSGGNMNLNVAGSLINNYASVIYSEGDLTIQKYGEFNSDGSANPLYNPLNNRITSLTNYGNIETYLGKNITIKAENFLNSRTAPPVSGLIGTTVDPVSGLAICVLTGGGGIDCGATTKDRKAANHDLYSWSETSSREWGEFGRTTYYQTTQGTSNTASRAATISSGGTLDIDSGIFTNYISEIYSKGNMTISANNAENFNKSFTYGRVVTLTEVYDGIGPWPSWCGGGSPCRRSSYSFSNYDTKNAYIKSGGSLTVTRNGSTTTSWTNGSEMDDYAAVGGGEGRDLNLVNNIDVNVLGSTGTVNTDISGYFNGPDNNGLFNRNPNPNGPLFETRSQFIDQSKFFGSDYFYQRIGLDLTDVQTQFELQNKRLVGDQFFQTKIIEEQLRTISKNSFLLSGISSPCLGGASACASGAMGVQNTNINNEIKNLLDNAADEYARLGLSTNATLTQSQINSLQKDIIWFETKTIDGNLYI